MLRSAFTDSQHSARFSVFKGASLEDISNVDPERPYWLYNLSLNTHLSQDQTDLPRASLQLPTAVHTAFDAYDAAKADTRPDTGGTGRIGQYLRPWSSSRSAFLPCTRGMPFVATWPHSQHEFDHSRLEGLVLPRDALRHIQLVKHLEGRSFQTIEGRTYARRWLSTMDKSNPQKWT